MKVGIYCRVSTEEQAREGLSLVAQEERCSNYVTAKGWEIARIYFDKGKSAKTLKRKGLQEMIQDAVNKKIELILVHKIDRLSRNLKDLLSIFEGLQDHNIKFSSVTEPVDTSTAIGEAFFQIIGVFAQLERGMIKERVESIFKKKIKDGECVSRAPYGYEYKNNRLVPDKKEKRIC